MVVERGGGSRIPITEEAKTVDVSTVNGAPARTQSEVCSKQRPLDRPREDDTGQYSRYVEYNYCIV